MGNEALHNGCLAIYSPLLRDFGLPRLYYLIYLFIFGMQSLVKMQQKMGMRVSSAESCKDYSLQVIFDIGLLYVK